MKSNPLPSYVNHEVWIEPPDFPLKPGVVRVYVKWGHYPKTDGRLDPLTIRRAFAQGNGAVKPLIIGMDPDATSRNALFAEFKADKQGPYSVAIEYDRGVYTTTVDKRWCFAEKTTLAELNYPVKESF